MIALWMLAAVAVAAALGLAALAVERVARAWGRPARHAWTVAVLGALLLPALAALAPRARRAASEVPSAEAPGAIGPVRLPTIVVRGGLTSRLVEALAPLDRPLGVVWLALSAVTLALVVRGALGLARARRSWRRHDVDGTPVLLADDVGPAVVGLRRPAIVLPEWSLTLDAPLRALVVRHETEHVRARDPLQLALGAAAVTLMPWNPALWWQLRRLRAALEIDCDARVLAAQGEARDVSRYGLLLLAVAQRRATATPLRGLAGAPALAESTSDLSRRIHAMRSRPPRHRVLRSAAGLTVAAAALAGAFAACSTSRDVVGPVRGGPARDLSGTSDVRTLDTLFTTALASTTGPRPARPESTIVMAASADGTMRPTLVTTEVAERLAAAHVARPNVQRAPLPMKPKTADGPYFEFQVEKPVQPAPGNVGPRYPDALKTANVEGTVLAQFVVDTTGATEMTTFKVLRSDHDLFTQAVKGALTNMKFEPALVGGRKVKQLVQQPFMFSLTK